MHDGLYRVIVVDRVPTVCFHPLCPVVGRSPNSTVSGTGVAAIGTISGSGGGATLRPSLVSRSSTVPQPPRQIDVISDRFANSMLHSNLFATNDKCMGIVASKSLPKHS